MNWTQIQKKYPKAYQAFIKWLAYAVPITIVNNKLVFYVPITRTNRLRSRQVIDSRRLYDFFDEHGIYVTIEFWGGNTWKAVVGQDKPKEELWEGLLIKLRKEAEADAFTKAFEILELRL